MTRQLTIRALTPILGPGLIGIAMAVGLAWSWGTWPDVVVDFGRELYVPWRLAAGDVLYRDIAYFNGPLSPYFNALLFRLFGTSLLTLVIANILVLAALLILLYAIISEIASRGTALLACLTVLALFAFAQMEMTGNSNWICPYAHEMTHGLTLAILSLYLLWVHACRQGRMWVVGSGMAIGLVFLTKCELFLAGIAADGVLLWLIVPLKRRDGASATCVLARWTLAMLAPVLLAFGLLTTVMPARDALVGTLGSWIHLFNRELTSLIYYRVGMGTNDVASNIWQMMIWACSYALISVLVVGMALICRRGRWVRHIAVVVTTVIGVVVFAIYWEDIPWRQMAKPWPLWMLILAVATACVLHRHRHQYNLRRQLALRLALTILAVGLLGKMILNVRLMHYGFALALPATLLLVAALWQWLPQAIARYGGHTAMVRGAVLTTWLVMVVAHLEISDGYFKTKTFVVGAGPDRFLSDRRGERITQAVAHIASKVQHGQKVTVLPEGVMLNYLARIPSTRYIQFIPPEMKMFGEARILEALRLEPPEWVVLVNRDDSEYGSQFFGKDYGQQLAQWILLEYEKDLLIGPPVFVDRRLGVLIARRKKVSETVLGNGVGDLFVRTTHWAVPARGS